MENDKALIKIDNYDLALLFSKDGSAEMLEKVKQLALDDLPGVDTAKDRKIRKSRAARVSASKTLIDAAGKAQVEEVKARVKLTDKERKHIRDSLDYLKAEVRGPVTTWENEQKAKKEAERLAKELDDCWDLATEHNKIVDQQRVINKENQRIADEKRIATEAQKLIEAQEKKRDDEKLVILQREAEAKAEVKREKEARQKSDLRAQQEKEQAVKQAKIDQANALKNAERERLIKEAKIEEAAQRKAADKDHRKRINNECLASWMGVGYTEAEGKKIIGHIFKGEIRHNTINY